jgi:hypothetical protein
MNHQEEKGREELWNQLSRAVDLRSSQDQVLWSIFGFFGATNAVLLSGLFASGDFPKNHWISLVIVIAGISVSITWHLIQVRALGHIKRHEALITAIERILDVPEELALSAQINSSLVQQYVGTGIPARVLIARFGWGATALWMLVGIISIAHIVF